MRLLCPSELGFTRVRHSKVARGSRIYPTSAGGGSTPVCHSRINWTATHVRAGAARAPHPRHSLHKLHRGERRAACGRTAPRSRSGAGPPPPRAEQGIRPRRAHALRRQRPTTPIGRSPRRRARPGGRPHRPRVRRAWCAPLPLVTERAQHVEAHDVARSLPRSS